MPTAQKIFKKILAQRILSAYTGYHPARFAREARRALAVGFHMSLVVKNNKVVGVISQHDVINAVFADVR